MYGEKRFREYIQKKITKADLYKEYNGFSTDILALYNEVAELNLTGLDEKEIISNLNRTISLFEAFTDTVYIETLNYDMALKVLGEAKKPVLDKIWEKATHPSFMSFEGRRLSYLIDSIKNTPDKVLLIKKVKYIYTDYHWTKSDHEINEALNYVKEHLTEKEKEVENIKNSTNARKDSYDTWTSSLSEEESFMSQYIQTVMLFRDIRKDPIAQIQTVLIDLVTELMNRAGIDVKYGLALNPYECLKGVEYLKSKKDEIIKRAEGNISIVFCDKAYQIELCDYGKAVEEFHALTSKVVNAESIKGHVANKGKITGRVRIVLDPRNYVGFMQGDVLVTSMTRPEFVPLMKMAGAVVTNEGGITCHAAIVSRELNIPCVIGTRTATRILKDGDMVEVDADKGIIKILT